MIRRGTGFGPRLFFAMSASSRAEDMGEKIRVVIGLGNLGKEYRHTRHNVGFDIVETLARRSEASWSIEKKWQAEVARIAGGLLVKPQTFMNLSGQAVVAVCRFHKIEANEILVVYDDVDLELGRLRFRASGSAAGHKGIKSIIQSLGTQDFARLKFGIGRKGDAASGEKTGGARGDLSAYVLGKFSGSEREELEKTVARAADAVNYALSHGLTAVMNAYNEQAETELRKKKDKSVAEADISENQQSEISKKETGTSEI